MTRRFGSLLGGLSAIGLVACGRVDSVVGALDASGGVPGASGGAGTVAGNGGSQVSDAGAATRGGSSSSGGASSAGNGAVGGGTTACTEITPVGPRLVRLSFPQLAASIRALLGDEAVQDSEGTSDSEWPRVTFPPLASASEGTLVTDRIFRDIEQLAQAAGKYVLDHFDAVTGCGAAPSETCAQEFVSDFTERAFRRPPSEAEAANILQVYSEAKGFGSTIPQAVEAAVTAALNSPLFVYRTELGSDQPRAGTALPLTAHELASELSYFLSDGPPDAPLLAAASAGALETAEQLLPHIDRLLESTAARTHLESAFAAYLGLPSLNDVPITDPAFTPALRSSMRLEARAFLERQLWGAPLHELVTSRQSRVDASLAALYGVAFPPAGATLDANGFAEVELPEQRAGILTQAGALSVFSRPDGPSVIRRGMHINTTLLCLGNPPFPEDVTISEERLDTARALANASEREKSAYRMSTAPCAGCHTQFDPLGLALENFDAIGRYRTTDAAGRAIDASVTLPPALGSVQVNGAAELGAVIAQSERLLPCLTRAFLRYALAEGAALDAESCAVRDIVGAYEAAGDLTLSGLLRQLAISNTLTRRTP